MTEIGHWIVTSIMQASLAAVALLIVFGVLLALWHIPHIQRIVFPFIDELLSTQALFHRLLNNDRGPGENILLAAMILGYAIITGLVAFGVFSLIGNLATPTG